jgi:hypothetical protein
MLYFANFSVCTPAIADLIGMTLGSELIDADVWPGKGVTGAFPSTLAAQLRYRDAILNRARLFPQENILISVGAFGGDEIAAQYYADNAFLLFPRTVTRLLGLVLLRDERITIAQFNMISFVDEFLETVGELLSNRVYSEDLYVDAKANGGPTHELDFLLGGVRANDDNSKVIHVAKPS